MDPKKITFRKAAKADKELIDVWLKKPHLKEAWHPKIDNNSECWLALDDKKPFALIVLKDAAKEKLPDAFAPWIENEGKTFLIDFAIGEKSYLGKGFSSETLNQFVQSQDPSIAAFLADPEVKNEKGLHTFEKAGFVKVSTFIRGQGFFKGTPHYLLKRKVLHNTATS